ncbi:MAG: helix-turn-helix domain-containing protein [Solidesulfovibrio sp. DCME]|uniref:helix-turn-helix domain-containing protein n=1 Tax=Solidesulfovibrio sp. DCME TaxID=3447380 RepID=UPI003D0A3FDC
MLTTREAAEALGVTMSNLRIQIAAGRLKAMKRGRDWFIEPEELDRYRHEHQQDGRSTRWKEAKAKQTTE